MSSGKLRSVTEPFSQWLQAFMRSSSLHPRAVAARADVSTKTVHEWLRGRGPLHPDHVIAMLTATGGTEPRQWTEPTRPAGGRQLLTETGLLQALERLADFLQSAAASVEESRLPRAYQERLRERLSDVRRRAKAAVERMGVDLQELMAQLERELAEYRQLLETESRSRPRGSGRARPKPQ